MTLTGYLVVAGALTVAACLQASIGFGMAMLAAPVVAVIDPSLVPGTLIVQATVLSLLVTVADRQHIDLRGTGWALVGRVPGTVAGALLVATLPQQGLALMLSAVVLLGVVLTCFGWAPRPHRPALVLAGSASGLFGTATSIGGPPMALVWQGRDAPVVRSTMSGFFLVGSVLSIATLASTGSIGTHTLAMSAALAPASVLGYVLSRYVNRFMDARRLRWAAIGVSTLGAVLLIGQQLL
ncbi:MULTISPECIES: sulfite exporter TauE/SafE family protein [unclassified Streptomyces]|uniref:sulfite exporter TauE/SafE family protein n=1 Tax=unclassified Streptomyces TaxID=2593676 RepID=UPI00278C24C9|nr:MULTISPECIES: sulfite exporter TauE/SafE family protein [unclassified Streptomyces]